MSTLWLQHEFTLKPRPRGFHLVTSEVEKNLSSLKKFKVGILHLFIQHTSASLTLNENADPDVRVDMESHFNNMIPENAPYYTHTLEGADDMPGHLKNAVLGSALTIPVKNGRLNLGTWQGIYFCEHRNHGGSRRIVATLTGEEA